MTIILVGIDTYQRPGLGGPIHLGRPTDVPDEVGRDLLAQRAGTGKPIFVRQEDYDARPIQLRLTDPSRSWRSALYCAQGRIPMTVPAGVAPYLLGKRRPDGAPLFAVVD